MFERFNKKTCYVNYIFDNKKRESPYMLYTKTIKHAEVLF